MSKIHNCPLCTTTDEQVIYSNELFRIISVNDRYYPGFIRLILNKHIVEMTDLDEGVAIEITKALLKIERVIRNILNPDKINLASFGNVVPHLHWHIIPRFINDRHFPNPIWGSETNLDYNPSTQLIKLQDYLIDQIRMVFTSC